jgi:hypothetical protein
VAVRADGGSWTAAAVIVAVPWFALADVFEAPPPALSTLLTQASAMASSPIVTVNLWFDRAAFSGLAEPVLGLPGRAMQWVFDKGAIVGDGARHLSLVSSGASPLVGRSNDELVDIAHQELMDALPGLRPARLLRGTVIREPKATFSLAPGQPPRPGSQTPIRGLFLAGDWLDTGLPATIESAVRSGHQAADLAAGS